MQLLAKQHILRDDSVRLTGAPPFYGEVAERFKAPVWKAGVPKGIKGWNPFLTASYREIGHVTSPPRSKRDMVKAIVGLTPALSASLESTKCAHLNGFENRGSRKG